MENPAKRAVQTKINRYVRHIRPIKCLYGVQLVIRYVIFNRIKWDTFVCIASISWVFPLNTEFRVTSIHREHVVFVHKTSKYSRDICYSFKSVDTILVWVIILVKHVYFVISVV